MPTKLKGLKVNEGSLVDKGANPDAEVILFKRDTEKSHVAPAGSFEDLSYRIQEAYKLKYGTNAWPVATFKDHVIVNDWGDDISTWYSMPWSEKDGEIVLGERTEVEQEIDFVNKDSLPNGGDNLKKAGRKISSGRMKVLKDGFETMKAFISQLGGLLADTEIEKGSDSMPISEDVLSKLPDEVKTTLEEMTKKQEELQTKLDEGDNSEKLEALTKKNEELQKTIDEGKTDEKTELQKAMDGASEEVKKQFEAMNEKVEKAETIAKEERETRVAKEFNDKAKDLENVGSEEEVAKMLRTAYDVSDEAGEKLEETLKAAHEKIKASKLLDEIGSGGSGDSDATSKLDSLAKAKAEKDGISFEKAYSEVIESDEGKELYEIHSQGVN